MPGSLSSQQSQINSKISALKTYNDISKTEKSILSKAGSSFSDVGNNVSTQLNKMDELQKRYLRSPTTMMDRMLEMLGSTRGNGPETFKYLRKIMIQTLTKISPEISKILREEVIKSLGCSQEQTYTGINTKKLQISNLNLLPISQGIYIPVKNIDLSGSLKIDPESWIGKIYFEKDTPTSDGKFKPYGGVINYPMNRSLRLNIDNTNQTFEQRVGKYYFGKSGENLFDIAYTTKNELGLEGDFFRVFLLDRENAPVNQSGITLNNIGEFLGDYYSTIELFSIPQVVATVVNYLTNFISIKARVGVGDLEVQSKFTLLLNRILGLCFDEREEIDVSGISKLGELDGVDESFFEFTEVDLRDIELLLSDVKQGVVTFQDCDNVKLPVNVEQLSDEIVSFSETESTQTEDEKVASIEKIVDSITKNPSWTLLYPNSVSLSMAVDRNFIKKLPIALASSVLNPKVLLPIFTMLKELEKNVKEDVNDVIRQQNDMIKSANTILQSGTTVGQQVSSSINDSVDFVKKNKAFVIGLVSKISALFIETLFQILKRDIFNLLSVIIKDIQKSEIAKKYAIILRLVQLAYVVARFVSDYRKCKSLLDEISMLLQLINSSLGTNNFKLPAFLNIFAALLPGFSPERATLNLIENLEKMGIPTGPLPDGSSNMMNIFAKSMISGIDREESENGKVETAVKLPPPFGLISTVGKKL